MKRFLIEYQTDGNPQTRHIVSRGENEHDANERFGRRMKNLNICDCQIEIFSITELNETKRNKGELHR